MRIRNIYRHVIRQSPWLQYDASYKSKTPRSLGQSQSMNCFSKSSKSNLLVPRQIDAHSEYLSTRHPTITMATVWRELKIKNINDRQQKTVNQLFLVIGFFNFVQTGFDRCQYWLSTHWSSFNHDGVHACRVKIQKQQRQTAKDSQSIVSRHRLFQFCPNRVWSMSILNIYTLIIVQSRRRTCLSS